MLPRLLAQLLLWLGFQALLLFWPAGTWRWGAGWAFIGLLGAGSLAQSLWLLRHDPGLLRERMALPVHAGQGRRDTWLIALIGVLWFAWFPLMAWDAARHGFQAWPASAQAAGAIGIALAYLIVQRVFAANSFASITVRVQGERAHAVIDTGPYAWVRHPMYGGAVLLFVAIPLLLAAPLGFAALPAFGALLVLRTRWEEEMLRRDLPGYAGYARRVRHRFIPGLW